MTTVQILQPKSDIKYILKGDTIYSKRAVNHWIQNLLKW